ncbi:MAG TPA: SCP2 sterol-binding domain-containing protein [Dehalococcoidia bacterium]|nr:SCP2 sterol-binding domain-containing protein [Dehalococcoidia bacterium]
MTPTKDQIAQFYRTALDRCLEAFPKLDEKEWDKKASEEWTAREHFASLVGTMERETLPLTRQSLAGETPNIPGLAGRSDVRPFRNQVAQEFKALPISELLDKLRANYGEHLALLESLDESDLDKPAHGPAWDRPGSIRDFFFASYLFLANTYQDVRKAAKKKLPHWIDISTPEQVNYHMSRIFHYMPLIFRSDKGADVTATYQFTMEGEGGGQWALSIASGRADAQDGPAEPHDIEIKTKPQLWIDLANGELNPAMAIMTRKVKLGGNAGLAVKLSDLFSAEE